MPIPKPNPDEKQQDFISRCMGNPTMVKDYPKQEQRAGVCHTQWDRKLKEVADMEKTTEALSHNDTRDLLRSALSAKIPTPPDHSGPWVRDVFDGELVYEIGDQLYKAPYIIDETGAATIGDAVKVAAQTVYNTIESVRKTYGEVIQEMLERDTEGGDLNGYIRKCVEAFSSGKAEEELIQEGESLLAWLREQAVMKSEDGNKYPAAAFAYAPDKQSPSTWKLRLWQTPESKVTKSQLGRAAAAFSPGGFRGQKVRIPAADVGKVKAKIRSEYRKLGVSAEDMPKWIKESVEMEGREKILEVSKVDISEATAEGIAKGELPVRIIQPGFNEGKGRSYAPSAIQDAAKIFEGAKMYANHPSKSEARDRPERSVWDWVATLEGTAVSPNGNAVGVAKIHNGDFKEMVGGLFEAGTLDKLGVSINAVGKGVKTNIEGQSTFLVENIVPSRGQSVDFVTEPGAGGQAGIMESVRDDIEVIDADLMDLATLKEVRPDLVESIVKETKTELEQEVKEAMDKEQELATLQEANKTLTEERDAALAKVKESDDATAKTEAQAKIKEAVDKAEGLPEITKTRLLERFADATTEEGIEEAIKSEQDYLATLKEAGVVKGLGESQSKTSTQEQLQEAFAATGMSEEAAKIAATGR